MMNRQVPCPVMPIVVVVLIILFILFSTYRIAFDVRFRIRCCCIDYSIIISLVGVKFIIIIIAFRLFTLLNRVRRTFHIRIHIHIHIHIRIRIRIPIRIRTCIRCIDYSIIIPLGMIFIIIIIIIAFRSTIHPLESWL